MLSTHRGETPEGCVNENLMAAYLEASLAPQETAEFESHVAHCGLCQQVLALAMRSHPGETAIRAASAVSSRKTIFRFAIPVPVLGVLILAGLLILLFFKGRQNRTESLPGNQVAELSSIPQQAKTETQNSPIHTPRADTSRSVSKPPRLKAPLAEKRRVDESAALLQARPAPPVPAYKAEAVAPRATPWNEKSAAPMRAAMTLDTIERMQLMAMNSTPPNDMLSGKDQNMPANAVTKQIGDKVFYQKLGMWIDRQCDEHRDDPIIEITPNGPEHESILRRYPELRDLRPAVVYWGSKVYWVR
jgi:hypothetical protein